MDRRVWKWIAFLFCGFASAIPTRAAEPDPQVVKILQNWESTSAERNREGLAVRTLQPYLGPIRKDSLLERFAWTVRSRSELRAVPVDAAERQFLPDVRISIDSDGLPENIVMGKLRHEVRDLMRTEMMQVAARESVSGESGIIRASFNEGGDASPEKVITHRVSQIISRWVAASKSARAVRTNFQRTDYDSATEVETHATGVFVYSAPHHGFYQSQPTLNPDQNSARIGLENRHYVQLPGAETLLIWSDQTLTQVNIPAQRYVIHERPGTPREVLGAGSFDAVWQTLIAPQSALPLVVGLEEKELRTNYEWELVADNETSIILRGTPVNGPDVMLYSSVQVVIDPANFRTRATRVIDAPGTEETVHVFNDTIVSKEIAALGQWQPDLSKFKKAAEAPKIEPTSFIEEDQPEPPPFSDE